MRVWSKDLDTLSVLMQILGLIVDCAKFVAVIIFILTVLACVKFLCLKWRGLAPSVAATAFIISMVGKSLMDAVGVFSLLWARLCSTVSLFTGGMYAMIVVFTVLLCVAILQKLEATKSPLISTSGVGRDPQRHAALAFHLSNSYLATTPVLLS